MGDLNGAPRRVLITGGSSGLGRGLALSYAAPGITLALSGRDVGRLEQAAADCRRKGAEVETRTLDVADADAVRTWIEAFGAAGPIDLAIANAGVSGGPQAEGEPEGLDLASRQIRTNLLGVVHVAETVAPAMASRGRGAIVVVASTAAYRGIPYMPAYAGSKAGVRIYGESLRALLAPRGVKVSVVVPGFFDSAMTDRFHGAKPLMAPLDAAVAKVRRGVDRGRARIVFPQSIALMMQITDVLPAALGDAILRRNRFRIDSP